MPAHSLERFESACKTLLFLMILCQRTQ